MKVLYLAFFLILCSCIDHGSNSNDSNETVQLSEELVKVKYAEGFKVDYNENYTAVISRSIAGNDNFSDTIKLIHSESGDLSGKSILSSLSSINCQSSTHLAFIDALDALSLVSGHCGIQYISNEKVKGVFKAQKVEEICLGESVSIEPLLSTNPDLFLAYPFAKEEIQNIESKGVQTFLIAEYLETHPLARLEWIKLFGVLLQKEKEANQLFATYEKEYLELAKEEIDTTRDFILNLPYGDNWYSPSANSLLVKLCEDAGFSYYYKDEVGTENMLHSTEQVWVDGTFAEYWIIIADRPDSFTKEELISEEAVYGNFKSVQNNKVIFCSSADSDYFFSGVIEPHIILKDLIHCVEPFEGYSPKYFHLLN
ncbi:MAG: iron complex transport system substrate-binding protein [Arenicella sp.]|jgi:iron complex transport system substrate-binding protein